MLYQDVWVRGHVVSRGQRDCENRYKHIRAYLEKLEQPLKVLDIGANVGYFSFRIAEDFNAQVTMIEANDFILDVLRKNNNANVKLIKKRINVSDLQQLAAANHYDVVLALSIVHHFDNYRAVIESIFKCGKVIFIEPPAIEETQHKVRGARTLGIYKHLLPKAPQVLTYTKNIEKPGKYPMRPLMVFDQRAQNRSKINS